MFDTIIKNKVTFVQANSKSYHNLGMYHKISIHLNVPPHKWDVDSKYVAIGFYANGESLIAHGNDELKVIEFIQGLIKTYNGED